MEPLGTAIQLDTDGDCPHCGRPILGLAHDRCDGCGRPIEDFETLPSVASRLNAIAPGWTVERLKAWAASRPAELAWAYQHRAWKNLGWWAEPDLWGGWARTEMSLRGRGKALQLEGVKLAKVNLAGLDEARPFVHLRLTGTRRAYLYDPASGRLTEGSDVDRPFQELWTARATGGAWPSDLPPCGSCGAGLPFETVACPHCGTPVQPALGPWSVIRLWILDARGEPILTGGLGGESGEGALDALLDALTWGSGPELLS